MLNNLAPSCGKLLISEPFMLDPNFKRSVIFLTEHSEKGSVGFVLNQKSPFLLSDLVEGFEGMEYQVYNGGPVGLDTLHFIHSLGDYLGDGVEVFPGIYWGGNFETLKILMAQNQIPEHSIKFFIGYSGWGIGQLKDEIEHNAWLVATSKSSLVFSDCEKELWGMTVEGMGSKYSIMVNFPENPNLN
jgi:putative transcriptional regulator